MRVVSAGRFLRGAGAVAGSTAAALSARRAVPGGEFHRDPGRNRPESVRQGRPIGEGTLTRALSGSPSVKACALSHPCESSRTGSAAGVLHAGRTVQRGPDVPLT